MELTNFDFYGFQGYDDVNELTVTFEWNGNEGESEVVFSQLVKEKYYEDTGLEISALKAAIVLVKEVWVLDNDGEEKVLNGLQRDKLDEEIEERVRIKFEVD